MMAASAVGRAKRRVRRASHRGTARSLPELKPFPIRLPQPISDPAQDQFPCGNLWDQGERRKSKSLIFRSLTGRIFSTASPKTATLVLECDRGSKTQAVIE